MFTTNGPDAIWYKSDDFNGKSLILDAFDVKLLRSFLRQSTGEVTITEAAAYLYAKNVLGQVIGWKKPKNPGILGRYTPLSDDHAVFNVDAMVLVHALRTLPTPGNPDFPDFWDLRLVYDHERSCLRLETLEHRRPSASSAPIPVSCAPEMKQEERKSFSVRLKREALVRACGHSQGQLELRARRWPLQSEHGNPIHIRIIQRASRANGTCVVTAFTSGSD